MSGARLVGWLAASYCTLCVSDFDTEQQVFFGQQTEFQGEPVDPRSRNFGASHNLSMTYVLSVMLGILFIAILARCGAFSSCGISKRNVRIKDIDIFFWLLIFACT